MSTHTLGSQSLAARSARNFFVHSGHVPLVLLILEALLASPGYFTRIDPYLLLAAGCLQALVMEQWATQAKPQLLWVNLVGPMVYSVSEALIEGPDFFMQWHHQAYWGFSVGFGVLQVLQARGGSLQGLLVLAENVLRSAIPLVIYALFEARSSNEDLSWAVFFSDRAHDFLSIVLLLLGVLLGFADVSLRRSLARVQELTARLRRYSEWSLGRGILDRAIADEDSLALKRVERAVLFLDIRGFTAWSEQQTPEAVVGMLNAFYAAAESALADAPPIKLKYTADEVMAVFASPAQAIAAGTRMLETVRPMLERCQLSAGAGVHFGQVVEGVLGAEGSRAYDFIGDTVNTAQRLCDAALPGELLSSVVACEAADLAQGPPREVHAKGKREPLHATRMNGA